MRRALCRALALAVAGPPLGVFLILRRMALTGDAVGMRFLPGAALGYLVSACRSADDDRRSDRRAYRRRRSGIVARTTILREVLASAFYLISLALGVHHRVGARLEY